MNENELISNEKLTSESTCMNEDAANNEKCRCGKKICICKMMVYSLFAVAIIVLYILHFTAGSCQQKSDNMPIASTVSHSGEIVYINIDSINTHYELVKILQEDIDAEKAKQEVIFQNRQKSLENKYAIFQKNYQSNQLTPVQIENTQQQLVAESQQLQTEYEVVMENLSNRQLTALKQISDSLTNAAHRINKSCNASFIFMYQTGGQLLVADPSKDITNDILKELNSHFNKKTGK